MTVCVHFNLDQRSTNWLLKTVSAIKEFSDAIDREFLARNISYEVATNASLFHTKNAFSDILTSHTLWKNQADSLEEELNKLEWIIENNPEALEPVLNELQTLTACFEECNGNPMSLLEVKD